MYNNKLLITNNNNIYNTKLNQQRKIFKKGRKKRWLHTFNHFMNVLLNNFYLRLFIYINFMEFYGFIFNVFQR